MCKYIYTYIYIYIYIYIYYIEKSYYITPSSLHGYNNSDIIALNTYHKTVDMS